MDVADNVDNNAATANDVFFMITFPVRVLFRGNSGVTYS
jgi:hypothetical protein